MPNKGHQNIPNHWSDPTVTLITVIPVSLSLLRFFSSICWPTNMRTVTSRVSWATSQDNTKYPSVMRLSVLAILALEQTRDTFIGADLRRAFHTCRSIHSDRPQRL